MPVEAFSLYDKHIQWVKNQPKGKRSAAVSRAIDYWISSGQIMVARDVLQERVLELDEDLKVLRKVGGRRVILAFLCGLFGNNLLSHALDLLEYTL